MLTTGPHSRALLGGDRPSPATGGSLPRSSGEIPVGLLVLSHLMWERDSRRTALADPLPPVSLRRQHLDDLAAPSARRPTAPGSSHPAGAGGWTDHLGEVGQDLGVEVSVLAVGRWPWQNLALAGDSRQPRECLPRPALPQGASQAPGGFQDNERAPKL